MTSRRRFVGGIVALAGTVAWTSSATAKPLPLVALVHTQAAGDNSTADNMIASLRHTGRTYGLETRAIYASDPANYQSILELLGEAGAAIVIVTFGGMSQPLQAVAPEYPATRFVQLYGDPFVPAIPNVRTVSYNTWLASYLSGMCGARMSSAPKLGYIGAVSAPILNANINAMTAGARSVRRSIELATGFVGSYQDPAKALEIANQLFAENVTYVQAEAAASDQGTIEAANTREGRVVSAGARSQFALGPRTVAAVTLCDFGVSLAGQVSAALRDDWRGGHIRTGLSDGVIDFLPSPLFLAHGPPLEVAAFRRMWPAILEAKAHILSGAINVPFKTTLA